MSRLPLPRRLDTIAVLAFVVALLTSNSFLVTSVAIPSVDLAGHVALTDRLREQLSFANLWFYDPRWFAGWPAFQFYGFLPHLIAALLSIPLSLGADDPTQFAVHLTIYASLATLPLSVLYSARPFAEEILGGELPPRSGASAALGVVVGTCTLWFLRHQAHRHGLGENAIIGLGFFAQVVAWHCALCYLGALARVLRDSTRAAFCTTVACYAALLLAHPLTFIAASAIGAIFILFYNKNLRAAISAHVLGFGVCGAWAIPLLVFAPRYTNSGTTTAIEDPLQLLFTDPLGFIYRALTTISGSRFEAVDPSSMALLAICIIGLLHPATKHGRLYTRFFCTLLFAAMLFTSSWTLLSVGIGLHSLRFLGILLLFALPLLIATPLVFLRHKMNAQGLSILLLIPFAICAAVGLTVSNPSIATIKAAAQSNRFYRDALRVQRILAQTEPKGRVFVEFHNSPRNYPVFAQRFIEARLYERSGFETLNGMTVQSAPSYHYAVLAASGLKAYTTAGNVDRSGRLRRYVHVDFPMIVKTPLALSERENIEQLRSLGASHVVGHSKQFLESMSPFGISEPIHVGPFFILQIDTPQNNQASAVEETIIGYYDEAGGLPFHLLSLYFFTQPDLALSFSLVELDSIDRIPAGVSAVLIHTRSAQNATFSQTASGDVPIIPIELPHRQAYRFGRPQYQLQAREEQYRQLSQFLSFSNSLAALDSVRKRSGSAKPASLVWSTDFQSIKLSGLIPGRFYRIPYSYFPFWESASGLLLRGTAEHMFLLAEENETELRYRPYRSKEFLFGLSLSILSAAFFTWSVVFNRSKWLVSK